MDETFVSVDLETTGLDPTRDEIIEIGAVKFRGDEVLDTFHTMVRPTRPLPYRIQVLTGIVPDEVADAPPLALVFDDLLSFIGDHPIVGQNVGFDLAFLNRSCGEGAGLKNQAYDAFEMAIIFMPTLDDYRLSSLAEKLGVLSPVCHRALPDATMAKDVFLALLDRARGMDGAVIAELARLAEGVDWPLGRLLRQAVGKGVEGSLVPPALAVALDKEVTLSPRLERVALDIEELSRMLGDDGPLARALPAFEHRPEQAEMMKAVAGKLNHGGCLIAEAGTGTGKSIAYLLPSILFAMENSIPVVVSTNTINLQEQLISKDIPTLARALKKKSLRYAQLKGRGNYLCMRRWGLFKDGGPHSLAEVRCAARIAVWLAATPAGDRSELSLRGEEVDIWSRVCAQAEGCLGGRCPYQQRGHCFLHRARRRAEGAHVIVVNHALLLSDIAAGSGVLPEYGHLIVDEAHRLEEEATEQWGFEVGERSLGGYLDRLSEDVGGGHFSGLLIGLGGHFKGSSVSPERQQEVVGLAQDVHQSVERARTRALEFFDGLRQFLRSQTGGGGEYERRLRLTREVCANPGWRDVILVAENLELALGAVDSGLNRLYIMLEPLQDIQGYENLMIEISSAIACGEELRQRIDSAVNQGREGGEKVYWIGLRGETLTLCAAPLHVGPILSEELFSGKECVVLTSATLSTEGRFSYIKERLGLADADDLLLGSSFDYREAALIYIPDDISEPGQPRYPQAVAQALIDSCRASGGRALALFTSHAALRAGYEAIYESLQGDDILVLGQGLDGSPRQLLRAFEANPRAVLLGAASFWEGVDVVGEGLSVLAIARLPFNVPTDPVFVARSELFDDPFNEYALPQAVLRFKQGFGRLIRAKSDRGVLVILDRRMRSKYYGDVFLGSLPQCVVKSGPARQLAAEVAAWLGTS